MLSKAAGPPGPLDRALTLPLIRLLGLQADSSFVRLLAQAREAREKGTSIVVCGPRGTGLITRPRHDKQHGCMMTYTLCCRHMLFRQSVLTS
jgi:hypothetical protein